MYVKFKKLNEQQNEKCQNEYINSNNAENTESINVIIRASRKMRENITDQNTDLI
jgi:hypothetical protein